MLTGAFQAPDEDAPSHHEHISMLPVRREDIIARLAALPGAKIHHSNASKLVVVLEGLGSGALGGILAEISGWPGVLSVNTPRRYFCTACHVQQTDARPLAQYLH